MYSLDTDLTKTEALIQNICQLAAVKDAISIKRINLNLHCLHRAVYRLAIKRDSDSVSFLVKQFPRIKSQDIVPGYAAGGHVDLIYQQLAMGARVCFDNAVEHSALNGYVKQVNQLIAKGASYSCAKKGYLESGRLRPDKILEILEATDDVEFRQFLINPNFDTCLKIIFKTSQTPIKFSMYDYHSDSAEQEILIKTFCQLAKVKDEKSLDTMNADFYCLSKATYLLALGKDSESVEFLMNKFQINRECAVQGYVSGEHVDLVDQELAMGASIHTTAQSYAFKGNVKQVNLLIAKGADHEYAKAGYLYSGRFRPSKFLKLLVATDDLAFRKYLIVEAKKKFLHVEDALEAKAIRINNIMKEYQLNFKEARSLTIKGARAWLLLGPKICREYQMVPDIFWKFTSAIFDLSIDEAPHIFNSVHNQLRQDMKDDLNTETEIIEALHCDIEERYEKRRAFY